MKTHPLLERVLDYLVLYGLQNSDMGQRAAEEWKAAGKPVMAEDPVSDLTPHLNAWPECRRAHAAKDARIKELEENHCGPFHRLCDIVTHACGKDARIKELEDERGVYCRANDTQRKRIRELEAKLDSGHWPGTCSCGSCTAWNDLILKEKAKLAEASLLHQLTDQGAKNAERLIRNATLEATAVLIETAFPHIVCHGEDRKKTVEVIRSLKK